MTHHPISQQVLAEKLMGCITEAIGAGVPAIVIIDALRQTADAIAWGNKHRATDAAEAARATQQ
jgi:hypothetical protein